MPARPSAALAARLPACAAADMVEWYEGATPEQLFARLLEREIVQDQLRRFPSGIPALTDDRPFDGRRFWTPATAARARTSLTLVV